MRSVVCAIAVLVSAVAVSACGVPGVRELDRKNAKMTAGDYGPHEVSEIKTPEELAHSKFFRDDASRDAIRKQVDFTKEKIAVVTWWGSTSSSVHIVVSKDGKSVSFDVVTSQPALADLRPHIHVFAMPKDMTVETQIEKLKKRLDEDAKGVVKLGLGVKFVRKTDPPRPEPVVIASADELAKSKLFADDESRGTLKNQIDFAKQKLVVFVWSGSGGDKLAGSLSKDGKTAVFTHTRGLTDDLREHAAAFAVPRDCGVKVVTS
jgi:hypothetical protein